MINYLAIFASLCVATVAAYYSIVGLSTIFSGAFWSVVIMASVLEFAKIITAVYVHLRWSDINRAFRYYLTAAVIALMLITSLGIFGFLSKAHIDSQTASADNSIAIELIDGQIQREQKVVDYVDSQFNLLDNAYEEWISKGYITRALNERDKQSEQREQLSGQQNQATEKINELVLRRSELEREAVRQEAEVGPIKYVAEIVYGDDDDRIDDAARVLILVLIFAFDPLALLLLLASTSVIYKENNHIPPIIDESDINDLREGTAVSVKEINEYIRKKREYFPKKK